MSFKNESDTARDRQIANYKVIMKGNRQTLPQDFYLVELVVPDDAAGRERAMRQTGGNAIAELM